MARHQFRLGLADIGRPLFKHLGDPGVALLARRLEQRLVGRVLDQRVLEGVGGVGRRAAAEDQLGGDQLVERGSESLVRQPRDRRQQR